MAPKKKGKGNKLAKMSEEERIRYLQHRADIEEEARRRKEELIYRYMKNKLQKEETFSKINLAKINQQWRFILRKLEVKDLQEELKMIIDTFTNTTNSKNAVICKLMDSLVEAEEQYSCMLQSHMELISQFLGVREDRLKYFQDNYDEQKFTLIESWEEELQRHEVNQKDVELHMKLVIYQQDENMKAHTKEFIDVKGHFIKYRAITLEQELNDMIFPKQLQLEKIWNELKRVFCDYVKYHSPKIQQYQLLRQKDTTYRKDINHNMELLLAASDMIAHFQHKWENLSEELEQKSRNLRDKRDNITLMSAKAKVQMMENHIIDKEQLTTLSVESYEAIKKLERLLLKGQKVQQMDAMCKKYEMEGENVLQWNTAMLIKEDTNMTKCMMDDIETYDKLENFWFKYNRVNVHTVTLRAERDSLRQENRRMKAYLKAFLVKAALEGSGSIKAEVSGRPSSMKMYRITPLAGGDTPITRRRPVTCIEASTCNAVQHERRMQRWRTKNEENSGIRIRRHCW